MQNKFKFKNNLILTERSVATINNRMKTHLAASHKELINKENLGLYANIKKPQFDPQRNFSKDLPKKEEVFPSAVGSEDKISPQLVASNLNNILSYIKTREDTEFRPHFDYMLHQRDINVRMRSILIDWLVDVNIKFKLLPQTLFMTVGLIDRYLALREVSRQKLQLVGVTALMIIGKYEEIYPPLLKDYVAVCDNAYSREEILAMESEMLSSFNFELNKTCAFVFLEYFRQKYPLDDRAFAFCRYLLENALLDVGYLKFNNLVLSAGAIYLVNKIFKREGWSALLESVTGVEDSVAKACAKELFAMINKIEATSLTAIKRKFALPEFFEVSKYKIEKVPTQPSNH